MSQTIRTNDIPGLTPEQEGRLAYAVGLIRDGNWYWTMYLVSSMMAADAILLGNLTDELMRLRGRRRPAVTQIINLMNASKALTRRSEMIREFLERTPLEAPDCS